jgi:hypothetical protein
MRPYFEDTKHKTGQAEWLKWSSACPANERPCTTKNKIKIKINYTFTNKILKLIPVI